jgi:hypothetical protein
MAGMLIGLGGSGRRASGRTVIGHPRLGFHCSPVLPKPSVLEAGVLAVCTDLSRPIAGCGTPVSASPLHRSQTWRPIDRHTRR